MLEFTQLVGETLNIGEDIRLTIIGVRGDEIRVSIDAPNGMSITGLEAHQRVAEEQEA